VTARAVGQLALLVEYAAPLLAIGGVLVAWKGAPDSSEVDAGAAAAEIVGLQPGAVVPVEPYGRARGLSLYVYSKVRETPEKFPRRPGMAAKRPLVARNAQSET
jgi:16S rRNA (guanine527-N7)-methyltransferase